MSALSQRLKNRFYKKEEHPYEIFEARVESLLQPGCTLLDGGCGRTAPVLQKFRKKAGRLIGVDLVDPRDVTEGIEYHKADLGSIPIESGCVDLMISRSVFEHVVNPLSVYEEAYRILKPQGRLVFLTANIGDYGTFVARIVPNRFHAKVVKAVEGRAEEDTFPTAFKTNSLADVNRLATSAGLKIEKFEYLNQYPNYFMFNGGLFLVGVAYERLTSKFHSLRFLRGWILVTLQKN